MTDDNDVEHEHVDRIRDLHNDSQVLADVHGTNRTVLDSHDSGGICSRSGNHNNNLNNASTTSSWLPLESNPKIFTKFSQRVSTLPTCWEFVDVLSIDEALTQLVPRPVAAVIMLFPCTDKIYLHRSQQKKELEKQQQQNEASQKALHIEQVASFGNACGTIACLHVLSNLAAMFQSDDESYSLSSSLIYQTLKQHNIDVPDVGGNDSPVSRLQKQMSTMDNARDRGKFLVESTEFHQSSDEAATSTSAQTECPATGDTHLGHHYVAFVPIPVISQRRSSRNGNDTTTSVDVHIVELDGTKVAPIDHGTIQQSISKDEDVTGTDTSVSNEQGQRQHHRDFLNSVMYICKKKWMDLEPRRIDFSLMALSKTA